MTELITPSVSKELLELTCKEFPNLPPHMVKMMYDFHATNPTYLQDNPEKFDESWTPKSFTETIEHAVDVFRPEDVKEAPLVEGLVSNPIKSLTLEDYDEEIKKMKADELKADLADEKKYLLQSK